MPVSGLKMPVAPVALLGLEPSMSSRTKVLQTLWYTRTLNAKYVVVCGGSSPTPRTWPTILCPSGNFCKDEG
jgi:hypothetical protein